MTTRQPPTWQDLLDFAAKSTRPNGDCQGFVGNDICGEFGTFVEGYASANAAMAASKALGTFHEGLPPSGRVVWVFLDFPEYGHDGLYYNGEALWDSAHCSRFLNAKKTVGLGTIAAYPYKLLGWSTTNGRNTLPHIPAVPTLASNQRVVVPEGANVRAEANASSARLEGLAGSTVITAIDHVVGQVAPGGGTNATWFVVAVDKKLAESERGYVWSGATTDPATVGIADGDPVTPPPVALPPVVVAPPASDPVTPPPAVDPAPSEPTPVVTPPATTTPPVAPKPGKPSSTPTTHPSAAAFGFTSVAAIAAVIIGVIVAWIQSR